MHLCYKAYTSSYRVVSICSEQEKNMLVYNLGIYIATLTWYQYTKYIFAYMSQKTLIKISCAKENDKHISLPRSLSLKNTQ